MKFERAKATKCYDINPQDKCICKDSFNSIKCKGFGTRHYNNFQHRCVALLYFLFKGQPLTTQRLKKFCFAYEIFVGLRKFRRMEKLTQQEEDLMQVIWAADEGNVKSFLEQMPDPKPPYTTVASTIKNLEKKGYVSSRLLGNTYLYKPAISSEDYKQQFMLGFVQNYFNNSYKDLVNFFVAQKNLKPKELKEIIDLIEKNK